MDPSDGDLFSYDYGGASGSNKRAAADSPAVDSPSASKRARRDDDDSRRDREYRSSRADRDRGDRGDDREYRTSRSDRDRERGDRGTERMGRDDRIPREPRAEPRDDRPPRDDREYRRSDRDRDRDRERDYDRRDRDRYDEYDRGDRRSSRRSDYDRPAPRGRSRERGGGSNSDLGRTKGFGFSFGGGLYGSGGRYSSPSPPRGTVPLDQRPRKLQLWDVAPPGWEGVPATQAKETGQFLLPCHKAVAKMTPGHMLGHYDYKPKPTFSVPGGATVTTGPSFQTLRQQRRLYVGNLPMDVQEQDLLDHFNHELSKVGHPNAAISASFGGDRAFAFVEFRDPADATQALYLDGVPFKSMSLRVKRPKDYVPPEGGDPMGAPGLGPPPAPHNPDKLFVGGIPHHLSEDQVKELLKSFGELRTFALIMDNERQQSKGYAFCEFVDSSVADLAIEGLNNMEIGDRRLVVQRASSGRRDGATGSNATPIGGGPSSVPPLLAQIMNMAAGGIGQLSRILLLLNMAAVEDLRQPRDYEDLALDVREECGKYGQVASVVIPKMPDGGDLPALAQVFVVFEDKYACQNALRHVAGRAYRSRSVVAAFYPEDRWTARDYYGAKVASVAYL
ncbi:U2 snRNP auxilliary factor, large subunit, splicing factor [Allomyces macrogynus ATCC 38327]|uniref:U2 snRNP auxilliary factor, large subunit, splicing factor n=1 Tax=Allomyces macrogynus (strain ATCC 38327) TaxID=578462 RepID=A0A0L0TBH4_ALLM3|nr:U2 snRNP auxilliary factor, large subunit, splicing factor [Allomyces macrogynus ATCC 38327]|eukprot:KNE72097.1 U2 snRNP auxilliary factor, large subunit, splicing factor [Allomyces macrogynus ATCC 38327]